MECVISTGSLRLDCALGIGGIPPGHITEISGDMGSGKTTLCLHILAQASRNHMTCAFIDADHTFDPQYAKRWGVVLDELYLVQPIVAEQAFDITERLARSKVFKVIVIDSLFGLTPREELSAPLGVQAIEDLDALLAKWLPNLMAAIQHGNTALVLTDKTHPGLSKVYHELESHLSRIALPMSAGLRLRLETISPRTPNRDIQQIQVHVVKNKFAPCSKSVDIDIIVNRAINKINDILDLGVESKMLSQQGTSFYFQGCRLGTTRQEVIEALQRNEHLVDEIERAIRRDMQC